MTIRITRNASGNCINFVGSSMPAYFNACLTAQINPDDSNLLDVVNNNRSSSSDVTKYEFYAYPYTEFSDQDGNTFSSAQETVDYINAAGNVTGVSDVGQDLSGTVVDFRLDQTSTSIILDNGASFGVNTIKAVPNSDGTIHIHAIGSGIPSGSDEPDSHVHFEGLEVGNVQINEATVSGGLNDIANALNELFTVGAFESVVISDPFSTMVADVSGAATTTSIVGNGIDPLGSDVYGSTSSGSLNGYKTTETIDQAGEYFTFDIRVEGQIGFGLVHSQTSYDNGFYSGNANYADPTTFGTSNSAHYGFQFSHWFHPTPNGPWTNYGANTGYIQGPGWANSTLRFPVSAEGSEWLAGNPVKMKVGLDVNGFIEIAYYDVSEAAWVLCARTSYPAPEGVEYHLGIKTGDAVTRIATAPKVHLLEPAAPTMYFRFIESPDGYFDYPLFATEDEANYYDLNHSGTTGSGTSTQVTYPDDPTATNWYRPTTGFYSAQSSAPVADLFMGDQALYTEITSLTNADLAPPAFSAADLTVNELSAVNYQTQPADTGYTTSISGLPAGLVASGSDITGTAPEVTGDNVANPSDSYTVTVTRTNSYGSSTGTFDIIVNNLTAPATAISGFNHHAGSTALVDSDTMDDGSAVHMNNTLADGKRFVILQSYVEANILPALQASGDKYYIGLAVSGHSFATVEDADFDSAIVWEYETATSHTFKFINNGSVVQNIVINSLTDAFYDYAVEINGTSGWLIACNVNSINTEPSPASGGSFSHTYESTNLDLAAPHTIHMAVVSTQGDFSTSGISQIDTPTANTNQTSWTKALDFSGSSERAEMVSTSSAVHPMMMGGINNNVAAPASAGNTSADANARPWATVVVFQSGGNSSNQHIWNLGEGAGSTDDNIFLRTDSNRNLWFGWGRTGAVNECFVGYIGGNIGGWWSVYVASNGTRLSPTDATAANLADAFDIRMVNLQTAAAGSNLSTAANWTSGSTGARMNYSISGSLSIGGRGGNRNFHGKVASFVTTTLLHNHAMPSDAEIVEMVTDPVGWIQTYKVGSNFRQSLQTGTTSWDSAVGTTKAFATQVYLMGDGPSDSYSNMIRNHVFPTDQNYTKLNLISMVSNDIQNITITGLS